MNKKYLIAIVIVVLLVVSSVFIGIKVFSNNDTNNTQAKEPNTKPANNTEELITNSKELENTKISKDKIEFSNGLNITSGDKIAIWLYSSPKFLGWFEVKEENGTKYVSGLEKALEEKNIDSGSHHLAITNKDNETLGYISIDINEDNNIVEVDAIKELGIPQDFYTYGMYKAKTHIHFNNDYTFFIDNENVYMTDDLLEQGNFYLKDKIKFKSGTFSLVEKDNTHTILNLIFTTEDDNTKETKVAIYKKDYGKDFGVYNKMEANFCSLNAGIVLLGNDVKFAYTFMNEFNNIYFKGC